MLASSSNSVNCANAICQTAATFRGALKEEMPNSGKVRREPAEIWRIQLVQTDKFVGIAKVFDHDLRAAREPSAISPSQR